MRKRQTSFTPVSRAREGGQRDQARRIWKSCVTCGGTVVTRSTRRWSRARHSARARHGASQVTLSLQQRRLGHLDSFLASWRLLASFGIWGAGGVLPLQSCCRRRRRHAPKVALPLLPCHGVMFAPCRLDVFQLAVAAMSKRRGRRRQCRARVDGTHA